MAKRKRGLPRPKALTIEKSQLLKQLLVVDTDIDAQARVLAMENEFRNRIAYHIANLPTKDAVFQKFNTSPFVLLMHAMQRGYAKISEIEKDILPAKQFSSMETSAGRMVEAIALPVYGWTVVESQMHTPNSAIDGSCVDGNVVKLTTLKSGPRCLNDEMSENFADAIIAHSGAWAREAGVDEVDFTYGVLYGTQKQSNKKDWHILRNIAEKLPKRSITTQPKKRWDCAFRRGGIKVRVSVRIGKAWWDYLGGPTCLVEMCVAMIRACVRPGDQDAEGYDHVISDLADIASTHNVPPGYNVSILQRSQLPWLFFVARHFCDHIVD